MPFTFDAAPLRPLPVVVLADTSGSMKGDKIDSLNHALRTMVAELAILDDVRGEVHFAVITFGGEPEILQPLAPVREVVLPELVARGRTPLGQALNIARSLLEDGQIIPDRAFAPTIVLISDGQPTDLSGSLERQVMGEDFPPAGEQYAAFLEWEPLKALHASERVKRAQRLAMGIGIGGVDDLGYQLLSAFINQVGVPVVRASEASSILRFLNWVTLSVATRTRSRNPNAITPQLLDLSGFADDSLML